MLRIRLQRVGRKHDPHFRVVLTDQKNGPKSGRFLDVLGSYDAKAGNVQLKGDKIKEWIAKGAQVSDTVHNMLVSQKIIEGKKINVLPKKTPIVKEQTEEEKAAEEAKETKETPVESEEVKETEVSEVKQEEEKPAEETKEEKTEEKPKEEKPVEEEKKEEKVEEKSEAVEEKKEDLVKEEKKEE